MHFFLALRVATCSTNNKYTTNLSLRCAHNWKCVSFKNRILSMYLHTNCTTYLTCLGNILAYLEHISSISILLAYDRLEGPVRIEEDLTIDVKGTWQRLSSPPRFEEDWTIVVRSPSMSFDMPIFVLDLEVIIVLNY